MSENLSLRLRGAYSHHDLVDAEGQGHMEPIGKHHLQKAEKRF